MLNKFGVGSRGGEVVMVMPPKPGQALTLEDILVLVSWLCVLGDVSLDNVLETIKEIENS